MNSSELQKILAEADENECFQAMSYIIIRLEYLRGLEILEREGYVAN